jgi:hypothetical protein
MDGMPRLDGRDDYSAAPGRKARQKRKSLRSRRPLEYNRGLPVCALILWGLVRAVCSVSRCGPLEGKVPMRTNVVSLALPLLAGMASLILVSSRADAG